MQEQPADQIEVNGVEYVRIQPCLTCGLNYAPALAFTEESERFCSDECQYKADANALTPFDDPLTRRVGRCENPGSQTASYAA